MPPKLEPSCAVRAAFSCVVAVEVVSEAPPSFLTQVEVPG